MLLDADKRIPLSEIRTHPWFLLEYNPELLSQIESIATGKWDLMSLVHSTPRNSFLLPVLVTAEDIAKARQECQNAPGVEKDEDGEESGHGEDKKTSLHRSRGLSGPEPKVVITCPAPSSGSMVGAPDFGKSRKGRQMSLVVDPMQLADEKIGLTTNDLFGGSKLSPNRKPLLSVESASPSKSPAGHNRSHSMAAPVSPTSGRQGARTPNPTVGRGKSFDFESAGFARDKDPPTKPGLYPGAKNKLEVVSNTRFPKLDSEHNREPSRSFDREGTPGSMAQVKDMHFDDRERAILSSLGIAPLPPVKSKMDHIPRPVSRATKLSEEFNGPGIPFARKPRPATDD